MSRSLAKTIKPGSEARSVENHTGVSYKPTERTRIRAIEPISFKEALSIADEHGKKHLMLGNGFSIALRPAIFTYNTLYERAKDSKKLSAEMQDVFDKLGTTDFELVMEALENAAILVSLYEKSNPRLAKTLKKKLPICGMCSPKLSQKTTLHDLTILRQSNMHPAKGFSQISTGKSTL